MFDQVNYYRVQAKVYKFLERPYGSINVIYHFSIFSFILLTLSLSAFMSFNEKEAVLNKVLFSMEFSLAVYFGAEFAIRLWSAGADARYLGIKGRLRFLTRVLVIVDMIILLSTIILLGTGIQDATIGSKTIQNLRFLQILRLLHIDRQATTWKMMDKIIKLHHFELLTAYYFATLCLLIMASLVYITEWELEATHPESGGAELKSHTFDSFGDALWWGIVTLLTVGYGDIVPASWLSKVFTCIFAFVCICLFQASATIIGVGLTLMVNERERRKQRRKQRPLAAQVIQTFYRERMLANKFTNISFYRELSKRLAHHEYMARRRQAEAYAERKPSKVEQLFKRVRKISNSGRRLSDSESLVSVESRARSVTVDDEINRIHAHSLQWPNLPPPSPKDLTRGRTQTAAELPSITVTVAESVDSEHTGTLESDLERGLSQSRTSSTYSIYSDASYATSDYPSDNEFEFTETNRRYQLSLVAVTRLRFMMCKRRFKQSRKPYDLDDISFEVSEKEMQQISKLRELQIHLDKITGKPHQSLLAKHRHALGLCQRMELIEQKLCELDRKTDLITSLATEVVSKATNGYTKHK